MPQIMWDSGRHDCPADHEATREPGSGASVRLPYRKPQVTVGPFPVVHQVKRDKAQHASGQTGLPLFYPERTASNVFNSSPR
jgi:hypothetical protein